MWSILVRKIVIYNLTWVQQTALVETDKYNGGCYKAQ